jgi:phosphoribosylamine--glycine ligase
MRILVIGSGGREHALVWKLGQSPRVRAIWCAPGNAGIERHARLVPISPSDGPELALLALRERIDLAVVGPEAPLAAGLVDHFTLHGIPVVGPSQAAARLESSKIFAKKFMERHGIPTARFSVHDSSADALARLGSRAVTFPLVVKADGLAGGKGVVVARDRAEAEQAIERFMLRR